jgi:hypothetical protein
LRGEIAKVILGKPAGTGGVGSQKPQENGVEHQPELLDRIVAEILSSGRGDVLRELQKSFGPPGRLRGCIDTLPFADLWQLAGVDPTEIMLTEVRLRYG